jgi:hypothetical protein
VIGTLRAVKFLVMAPFILALLFVINWMTWSGVWWVQWAALGIRAIVLAGGLAALGTLLYKRR